MALKRITIVLLTVICSFEIVFASNVKVGFIVGLTGGDPNTARELQRGIQVFQALEKKSASKIEVVIQDNEGSVEKTVTVMDNLYKQGVRLFIGLANSNQAMAAAKFISEKPDTILITPFATNPKLTQISNRVFRTCFDDNQQGEFLADYTNQNYKAKKVLVLQNKDSLYSQGLSAVYLSKLQSIEHKVFEYSFNNQTTLTSGLMAIGKEFDPDLLFIPDSSQNAAKIAKIAWEAKKFVPILGGDGLGGNVLFHAIFPFEKGMQVKYSTYWNQNLKNSTNDRFVKSYKENFPDDNPSSGAALTFEAFLVLSEGLKKTKWKTDNIEKLRASLQTTKMQSTTGPFSFLKDHGTPARMIVMMKLQEDGAYLPEILKAEKGKKK